MIGQLENILLGLRTEAQKLQMMQENRPAVAVGDEVANVARKLSVAIENLKQIQFRKQTPTTFTASLTSKKLGG